MNDALNQSLHEAMSATAESSLRLAEIPEIGAMGGVDLNYSALIAAGIFLLVWLLLKVLLFDPYLKIVRERDKLMGGTRDDASEDFRKADELAASLDERLTKAREEATARREALRVEGEQRRDQMLNIAREEAETMMAAQRETLDRELAAAGESKEVEARAIASAIVGRILQAS